MQISNTELLVETVQKLSLVRNIESIMEIVRTIARKITGADGATFVLRDGNLCYYADEDAISPLWKGNRFPMEKCISGWVMLNKKSVVIDDIYADERIPADAYRPTFVKSLAMVPIRTLNPIGAIGNYWGEYWHPTEREVALLQALADITAVSIENIEVRNKLEDQLYERTQMLDQLRKQTTQLEEFTHIIAHNMRAPLSNLLLLTDMIKESNSIDEKLMYIDKQQPIIDYIHETFEELVEAIYVKTDFSVTRDHIELEKSIHKALNLLQGEIAESKAVVTYDLSEANTAYFPRKYLDSILFNLLSNSIKYRSPDRIPQIHIKSYKKDGWTYFEIRDNGLGIDLDKNKDKIFTLRKTFHQHPKAKGFGLFITRTQIEAMGGSISVASKPDMGSTFTVKLFKNI
ncbi:MAG: ATP-binding protein [Mangrovibacterium sp.]